MSKNLNERLSLLMDVINEKGTVPRVNGAHSYSNKVYLHRDIFKEVLSRRSKCSKAVSLSALSEQLRETKNNVALLMNVVNILLELHSERESDEERQEKLTSKIKRAIYGWFNVR